MTEPNKQLSIEFAPPANPESVASLRASIMALPEAVAAQGINLSNEGDGTALHYRYDIETPPQGGWDVYQGTINPAHDGTQPVFTAKKYREIVTYETPIFYSKWDKAVSFTDSGDLIVTEHTYERDGTTLTSKDGETRVNGAADVAFLEKFVADLPGELKAVEDKRAAYNAAQEARRAVKQSRVRQTLRRVGLTTR